MEDNATDLSMGEFFGAMDGTTDNGGYQTEEVTETESTEQEPNEAEATQEAAEAAENPEEADQNTDEQEETEAAEKPQEFHIKVNKEERTVSLQEMTALAQKGADYDRVKEQAERHRGELATLNEELGKTREAYTVIEEAAKDAGTSVPEFLDELRIQRIMSKENCSRETGVEKLARMKAEAELEALKKQPQKTGEEKWRERYDREVAEFTQKYPDVDIAELPADRIAKDIAAGKTMTQSYQDYEMEKKDAEIKRLADELAAEKQNRKNKRTVTGSASDSGSKKNDDEFSDFWRAFG